MKKKSGWIWMLGIAIGCAVSAVMAFLDRQYEGDLFWTTPLIGAVVFAFLAYSMRKKEAQAKEARLAEEQARRNRFRHESFPVAGVTFKNEDKTDRQQILREIALNAYGSCPVTLEEDEEKGEASAIRVMTEFGCVGHIRHNDKAKVRRFFDRPVNTIVLAVERFENEDGEKIYRSDVVIGMDREDPDQQWYFDELPESEM